MKIHSENYIDTFIQVTEDTKVDFGTVPSTKMQKTDAKTQVQELIAKNPYTISSDDIFQVFSDRGIRKWRK